MSTDLYSLGKMFSDYFTSLMSRFRHYEVYRKEEGEQEKWRLPLTEAILASLIVCKFEFAWGQSVLCRCNTRKESKWRDSATGQTGSGLIKKMVEMYEPGF